MLFRLCTKQLNSLHIVVMSRKHEDRKDMYGGSRESALTSASNIHNIHSISQNMEKEKVEKPAFVPHSYSVNDSGFRTCDLLKQHPPPQGRSIVPASQIHAMPPLLPNYISGSGLLTSVPMNHTLVRGPIPTGQHGYQSHIPVGICAAPPRGTVTMTQRSLPSLKPTNYSNQIQLPINQIPGLPTILPPSVTSSRTGSPSISNHHSIQNDIRIDSRSTHPPSPHGTQATIQVIASGTAVQPPHIPASFLSKNMNLNATSNMLKIGVTSHSNASPSTGLSGSAFKLGIGKTYPGSSSVILPGSISTSKPYIPDGRLSVGPSTYNRFPTACLPNHHSIQSHPLSTPITSTTPSLQSEPRPHAVGVPYHPISGAYVFQEMGLHSFSQLIRPPSTSVSSLPMFPSVPLVTVTSKGAMQSDSLTIHSGTVLNTVQPASYPSTFSSATSSMESSVRPSILRKRPAETPSMFPVRPSEKERISSPVTQQENVLSMVIPSRVLSPSRNNEKANVISKPTNHSILSITSNLKNESTPIAETPVTASPVTSAVSKVTVPPVLLTNNLVANNIVDASPKKKPRKQLIITTEDKYATTTSINSCATDEDEEFLKANETMKDITPPKLIPSSQQVPPTTSHLKQLFTSSTETVLAKSMLDQKDQTNSISSESRSSAEPVKYYVFHRKPQVSILSECKINTKAARNHFYRYSDVKVKDEKKSMMHDKFLNKSSLESSSGWRLHHLSLQFDDLVQLEGELCDEISLYKKDIPSPSVSSPNFDVDEDVTSEDSQLRLLHDLLQGNIQRCKHSIEQLEEAKQTMFNLLEHKPKYIEIRKQRKEKSKLKKKGVS